ncbi:predicted protein [Enterococcus gallinarum EG2]|nr:predicted protein [Enterococcus gallinarum EG2]
MVRISNGKNGIQFIKSVSFERKIVCPRYGQQGQRYAELGWYRERSFRPKNRDEKVFFYMKNKGEELC